MDEIIQGLWVGDKLSPIEELSIKSFLANGHAYHLYVYEDVKNVPQRTQIKDANSIIPENKIFTYQKGWGKGSFAGFSNFFRYQLLLKKGNWWVDTDVICLKPIHLESEIVIATSYEGKWGVIPNSNVLKFPPQSSFIKKCVDYCDTLDPQSIKFGQTGPHLVQRMVKELNFEEFLVPYYFFNPISWFAVGSHVYKKMGLKTKAKEFIRPFLKPSTFHGRHIQKESFTVHLWNEVWKQAGLSKEESYHPSSLIERLKRKYP